MKHILTKKNKYIAVVGLFLIAIMGITTTTRAAFVYNGTDIPYTVDANQPPVSDAGPDIIITLPSSSASRTATANDPDGTITASQWSFLGGPTTPSISSTNLSHSSASISHPTTLSGMTTVGDYYFNFGATDNNGVADNDGLWVQVLPPSAISVDISANPTTMTLPIDDTTLTWTTSGTPDSCTATNAWSGSKNPAGGSQAISNLSAGSYTFEITCSKSGTPDASDSVMVVVNPAIGTPTGTLSATDCNIAIGGTNCASSVTWTTADLTPNPTAVTKNTPAPNTPVSSATSGTNVSNTIPYGATTFFLYHNGVELAQDLADAKCTIGSSWNGSLCEADVTPTPSVTLNAGPATIFSGNSSTLSWTSANVSSCTASSSPVSGSWNGSRPTMSSFPHESTGALYATTIFTISCTGAYGPASSQRTVTVVPAGSDVVATLSANPDRIASGESSDLSWSSVNATSCTGIGFSTGGSTSGTISVSPTVNTTYTVNCTNGTSSASDQASITLKRKFFFIEF